MRLSLAIFLFLLLGACAGPEINYLANTCDPLPRVEVLKRPPHPEAFELGKACFVYWPEGEQPAKEKALANTVYRALERERLFRQLKWAGRLRFETLFTSCADMDYLVTLEGFEIQAANKTTPGKLAVSLSVRRLHDENTLWHLTGVLSLCPQYPQDYKVFLSRGSPPYGSLDHLQADLYFLVRILASFLKS